MRISDWSSDVCSSDLTHREVSTLFWINAGLGMVAALLMVPLAPLLAWFYGEPELSSITLVLGIGFALSGLSTPHLALLRRQMRFSFLASIRSEERRVGESGCQYV